MGQDFRFCPFLLPVTNYNSVKKVAFSIDLYQLKIFLILPLQNSYIYCDFCPNFIIPVYSYPSKHL